jgi:hypothetical protein
MTGNEAYRWSDNMRGASLIGLLLAGVAIMPAGAAPPPLEEMAARIDELLAEGWQRAGVEPAPPASDAEFLRRAWLDLCGIIPPLNDADGTSGVRNFLASTDPNKRAVLIQRLLAKPRRATHLATIWQGVLLPSDANSQQFGESPFQTWLRSRLADNAPYDVLIEEIVLARGRANQPGPALFFTSLQLKPEELAASTSRVFLGTQIQCAQCHDHPFDHWRQQDFWAYAAFFSRLTRNQRQAVASEVQDVEWGDVTLPGTQEVVLPRFLGGELSSDESAKTRRERLAQWLTWPENPFVARAAVNRVWAQLFGRGLVEPVDDLGPHNPPSHPQLLDELATYFVRTGYDLNRLTETLAATRAYQLSSQSPSSGADRPELFARMAVKSLTAEQLYDCLLEATRRREIVAAAPQAAFNRTVDTNRVAFLNRFRAPTQGPTEYEGGVPQALTLMNGPLMQQATDLPSSDLLAALDAPFFTNYQRIEVLYLSTLARLPDDAERRKFGAHVEQATGDTGRRRALGDILWALLNSAEFTLNH